MDIRFYIGRDPRHSLQPYIRCLIVFRRLGCPEINRCLQTLTKASMPALFIRYITRVF